MKRGQRQVFKLEKLQNHSIEGKGKEKKKERGEGKEEKRKKSMVALLVFIIATLAEKNCWTQKVHLAITFSKIGLDIDDNDSKRPFCKYPPNSSHVLPLCFLFDFCCTFFRIKQSLTQPTRMESNTSSPLV